MRTINPDVPADLEAICLKCLEKVPQQRYGSAGELAADLRRFLRGEVVAARQISTAQRLVRWSLRNPAFSSMAAAVLLLLLLVLVGSSTAAVFLAQAQKRTLDSLEAEIRAKDKATKSEDLALRALFEARVAEARASRNSGHPRSRTQALEALAKAAAHIPRLELQENELLPLRNEAIASMALVDLRLDCQWPGQPPRHESASTAFDAEIGRYARLEADGRIVIRRLTDNVELMRLDGLGRLNHKPGLLFSPDGKFLAVRGMDGEMRLRVRLWNLAQPEAPIFEAAAGGQPTDHSMDFSPDSQRLAFVGAGGTLQFLRIESQAVVEAASLGWSPAWIRFSPTRDRFAVPSEQGNEVLILSSATGRPVIRPLTHAATVSEVAWSASGQLLAAASRDGNVLVWDAATGRRLSVCQEQHDTVHHIAFHPTDELLMSSGWGRTTLWEPLSGRPLVRSIEGGLHFSHDGRWLGLSVPGVAVGRWEVSLRPEYFTFNGHPRNSYVYSTAFHPDGRLLASTAEGDGIRLWDCLYRREVAHIDFGGNSVAFSADGGALLVGGAGREALRVPITRTTNDDNLQFRLGEPQRLADETWHRANVSFSSDGQTLVTSLDSTEVAVIDAGPPARRRVEIQGSGLRFHDLSPNGKLVAIGNWDGADCTVWNARDGALIKELSQSGSTRVRFSPDSRWLASSGFSECVVWDAETWEPRYRIAHDGSSYGVAAFSGDSRMLAVATPAGVRLIEMQGGREVATLYPPGSLDAKSICFSPDGRRLAVGTRGHAIRVWDIGRIRQRLRELNVDWQRPALSEPASDVLPLQVVVDSKVRAALERPPNLQLAHEEIERLTALLAKQPDDVDSLWNRASNYIRVEQFERAIDDCNRAIALEPENRHPRFWRGLAFLLLDRFDESLADFRFSYLQRPDDDWCLRHIAWIHVGGPPELRDAEEAKRLAESAVKWATQRRRNSRPLCLAVLGMAHYRLGEFDEAQAALDAAIQAGAINTRTLLFAAMCHHQRGDHERAWLYFEEALHQSERQRLADGLGNPELLFAEAKQVIQFQRPR